MRHLALPLLFALVACGGDSDGDGLSNADEKAFGSNPELADSDGDGLFDLDEFNAGSDPNVADTDGDTYLDLWEVNEGTDPANLESRIYRGYWPYNPNKANLAGADVNGSARIGDLMPAHIAASDQHGDAVNLQDLIGHGKPVVIDVSAQWCPPCQQTAGWLAGTESASTVSQFDGYFPGVRQAVNDGDIIWVTILAQDNYGNTADTSVLEAWDTAYPVETLPVLNDPGDVFFDYIYDGIQGFPNYHYIDGAGRVQYLNERNSQYQDFGAVERAAAEIGL